VGITDKICRLLSATAWGIRACVRVDYVDYKGGWKRVSVHDSQNSGFSNPI